MKKRKLKYVIITIVSFATLLPGVTFAIPDAREQLTTWYQNRFHQVTQEIESQVDTSLSIAENVTVERNNTALVSGANEIIQKAADDTKWYTAGTIMIHAGRYIDQIRSKSTELVGDEQNQGTISSDFDQYISDKKGEISQEISQYSIEVMQSLNQELDRIINTTE